MKNVFSKNEPVLVPCETSYSFFFDLIEKELPGPNNAPLHRICSLMRKLKVKCFLREELDHDQEIKEEVDALSVRTDTKITATAVRFTFFRKQPPEGNWQQLVNNLRGTSPVLWRRLGRKVFGDDGWPGGGESAGRANV